MRQHCERRLCSNSCDVGHSAAGTTCVLVSYVDYLRFKYSFYVRRIVFSLQQVLFELFLLSELERLVLSSIYSSDVVCIYFIMAVLICTSELLPTGEMEGVSRSASCVSGAHS